MTLNEARLLKTYGTPEGKMAKVYKDAEWSDHIVKYYDNGKHLTKADSHHYDDKEDAHNTAQLWVNGKPQMKTEDLEKTIEEMTMASTASKNGKVEWINHGGIGHSVTVNGTPAHKGFLDHKTAAGMYKKLTESVDEAWGEPASQILSKPKAKTKYGQKAQEFDAEDDDKDETKIAPTGKSSGDLSAAMGLTPKPIDDRKMRVAAAGYGPKGVTVRRHTVGEGIDLEYTKRDMVYEFKLIQDDAPIYEGRSPTENGMIKETVKFLEQLETRQVSECADVSKVAAIAKKYGKSTNK